jgi:hypothetical protein
MAKKDNRCWPGYEPVKGKKQHEQGSCRPKAESKLSEGEKEFRGKRASQLAEWKKEHPGSPTKAAQHLSKPGAKKTAPKKKSAARKKSPSKG